MANRRYIDFPIASTSGDTDIILIWQGGANKQTTKATFLSGLPENLDELNDVAISGLTNGQILRYDSVTGKWENTDQGNLDLNDLNDVSIVSPSNGQVLVYNSSTSKWENSSGGYVPYTGAVTTVNLGAQTIQAGQFVKAGGTSAQFLKADGSVDSNTYGTGTVTSVALTMPSAFSVANSPVTTAGTLAVTGAGTVGQYIRGDGSLADFPESSGGGSSVSYYLNGSVAQGTIGGIAYKELNKVPILGAGTDFTINADGYIASFLTDAGDPNLLEIPGGNWNFETYFSASSSGGTPTFYVELYKVNSGGTATLIASNSGFPELIAFGTNIISYFSTLAVPTTTLALTDRLAIRYYVTHSGRTITLHTEDNHLCQIITTFTTGLTSLNGLTAQVQNLAVGTSGTDFNIASATATHTFNLPTASATNRGALSSADWTTFNNKQNALGYVPVPETRTITINGVSQDLSANRTYNVGTVTSVGLSSATSGVTIGSSPVTTSGTITLAIATASGSQNGLLSSTDWTTFNSKQNALTNPVTGTGTTNYLPKFTGSTTIGNSNLINDANGNLGLGVTPSAWSLGTALDVANGPAILGFVNETYLINNAYFNSGFKYKQTSFASMYVQNSTGEHRFFTAPSGTAGNPISFTQAMTLFSTGNLLVGSPSPISDNGARLQVSGVSASSALSLRNTTGGTLADFIITENTGLIVNSYEGASARSIDFRVANASALFVASSGNVGIGVSPSSRLHVKGSGTDGLILERSAAGQNVFIKFQNENGVDVWQQLVTGTAQDFSITRLGGSGNIQLASTGGNVLIGTTTDAGFKLDVNGTTQLADNVQINNGVGGTSPKIAFGTETPSVQGFKGIYLESYWMYMQVHYNEGLRIRAVNGVGGSQTIATFSGASGNLSILGALSKGSGSFKIDHPLPEKKDTHHLVHSFIEGPQADNIYRGKINLVNGYAEVNIDEASGMTQGTFVLLNGNVQCFTSNESGWTAIKGRIDYNILKIESEDSNCNDTVSWMVIGERHDQHMKDTDWTDKNGKVIVEPLKN